MSNQVKLPDGKILDFEQAPSVEEVAATISDGLARVAVAGAIGDRVLDLSATVPDGAELRILTDRDPEALEVLRHSTAHIMAMALRRLYPNAQYTIGPVIEDGFFYDFDLEENIGEADLAAIESEMKKIIKEKIPFQRSELPRAEATQSMKDAGQEYKVEIIADLEDTDTFSFYQIGEFTDLCRGPHIPHSGRVKAFKLMKLAGAYWRGDNNNKVLQRIYGTAFFKKKDLDEHLHLLEEAKKRDHRKIGKELGLFSFHKEAHGFPFYLPKGAKILDVMMNHMKTMYQKEGYQFVQTPILLNVDLWEKSGHYDNYRDNMYFVEIDDVKHAIKPMNCPGHCLIFGEGRRSYRELPLRMAEFGLLHRHELSGVVDGIKRTRFFTQDDAHIFCTEEQIEAEVRKLIDLIRQTYKELGFNEFKIVLATKPEKHVGSDEMWEKATAALRDSLDASGVEYVVKEGDGAFYGPKIDFDILDALKRSYSISTIQIDFSMPERFDLKYVAEDSSTKRPVMIHRAICGSFDRTLGILLEHHAGVLPVWLAPEQVRVLNLTDDQADYASAIKAELEAAGIRVSADLRNEKIGFKIREATLQKVPYMLVCGAKEVESRLVAVRERKDGDQGAMAMEAFLALLQERITDRT